MTLIYCCYFVALLAFYQCIFIFGQQEQVSGANDVCAQFCDKKYANETEPIKSCKQGCRLFSILQLTYKNLNETDVRQICESECGNAYKNDQQNIGSCEGGCKNQSIFTSGSMSVEFDQSSPFFKTVQERIQNVFEPFGKLNLRDIFDQFNGLFDRNQFPSVSFDNMFDRMKNLMQTQLPIFGEKNRDFSSDFFDFDKPIVEPSMENEEKSIEQQTTATVAPPAGEQKLHRVQLQRIQNSLENTVGNMDENSEPIIVVHMVPDDQNENFDTEMVPRDDVIEEDSTLMKEIPHEPSPPLEMDSNDNWFACMSRRLKRLSTITRWMLCLALLLSIASMIWICMAIIRTTPKRHLHYISTKNKGGVDNVYYTTPPATVSDKAPMIIATSDYTMQPEAPPPYETTKEQA